MDPISALGVAASIIAVVQLSSALLKPVTSSLGPSENDANEINRLLTTMTGFRVAYSNLENYLKNEPGTTNTLVTAIEQPLRECKVVLVELRLRLSNMTFVRKRIIGAKWDKKYNRLIMRLDDARKLFDIILQGDQSQRLIEISEFLKTKFVNLDEVKEGVEASATRLSELHLTVQDNYRATQTQAAEKHSDILHMLENNHDMVEQRFSGLEKIEQRRQKDEILQWLEIADPRTIHQQACVSHKPGTGDWFLMGQDYREWLAKPGSFLWLNGKAGCGKTVLSSTIIESIATHCDINEGCVVAYFYFSFSDQNKQSYTNMLRSLLMQIASQIDLLPDCLISLHRAYQRSEPPVLALTNAFQKLVDERPINHVYVHVDALDEIPDTDGREATCKILDELSRRPKVHIVMTSRREHDITEYVSECEFIKDISIQNSAVDHDIRVWVRERLKEDRKLKKWSAIHEEIEVAIGDGADGMFRWAACQLDSLKRCLSAKSVQMALKALPKTLDETYERILLAIDEECQEVAIAALRWLCFSAEGLSVGELAEAAVFSASVQAPSEESPFEVCFDSNELIENPFDILIILSGLVTTRDYKPYFDEGSNAAQNSESDSPRTTAKTVGILLAHFSVKEYLVSRRLGGQVRPFAMGEDLAHEQLSTTCIYYVLFSQPCLEYPPDDDLHNLLYARNSNSKYDKDYALLRYAAKYWLMHTQRVEDQTKCSDIILSLFSAELPIQWCLFYRRLEAKYEYECYTLTPLYILSALGLYLPVNRLLRSGTDMLSLEGRYGSALQVASCFGYGGIVQLLIDHGADVNLAGGIYGCALQAASFNDHKSIVQLLLDRGADTDVQGGYYGSALQAASSKRYQSIVQLLLGHRADVNLGGGYFGSALQAATHSGDESIVQLLLNHGADVNIMVGPDGSALQTASYSGYESIVKRLLDYGAEVNARGGLCGTALVSASFQGHTEVVRILLDHGADVNLPAGELKETPIQAALAMKHADVSVMLLARGALLNQRAYIKKCGAEAALARMDFERFVKIVMKPRRQQSLWIEIPNTW